MKCCAYLALVLLPLRLPAADAPWAVKGAAFRIVLQARDTPADPAAGTEIAVPDLNPPNSGAGNYTLTDAAGTPVPVAVVWHGEAQRTLLLASGLQTGREYFLYVGGPHGPDWAPKTSLLLETRTAPGNRGAFTSAGALQDTFTNAVTDGARFVNEIKSSDNPFGEQHNFLSHYTGFLNPPEGDAALYTNSSDASFVLVNGAPFLDLPGDHGPEHEVRRMRSKKLPPGAGPVRIDYYHAKTGEGPPFMILGLIRNGRAEEIPPDAWLHPATSEILRAENVRGQSVPLPEITTESYIGWGGGFLYDVHGRVAGPDARNTAVTWRFSDGAVMTGPRFERVMAGNPSTQFVTMEAGPEAGGLRVTRRVEFAGPPPKDVGEGKRKGAGNRHYLDLLVKEDPTHLTAATLGTVLPFLFDHGTDAQIAPFAVAWLKFRPPYTDASWLPVELAFLRSVAVTDPKAALAALHADNAARARYGAQLDLFEIELLVFYERDLAAAPRVQQMAFGLGDTPEGRLASIRLGDLYRLNGDVRQATLKYEAAQPPDPSHGRRLPAEDQANSLTVGSLIDEDERQDALDKLTAWELEHPMAKLTTDFLLLRSRVLTLYGRWREALAELSAFAATHPDSPYQIDVDFYRARALHELGRKDEARKIWLDLAKDYPKSDLAASSKEWAEKP